MSRSLLLFAVVAVAGCSPGRHETLGDVQTDVAVAKSHTLDRKVIFDAAIKLFVADLSNLERAIPKLVTEHEGFLAQVSIDRSQGKYLTGRWIARVPVGRYETFLEVISQLGVPDTFDQRAQDVTEEYVDLETRVTNEKRLEERILELLKKPEGDIEEVIEVERELARVRGEIEKMEGRLRFLANRTEFTMVTIDAIERETYVPPQAPTLQNRVAQTWWASLNNLRKFGEDLLVGLIGLFPWLVLFATLVAPAAWAVRRNGRRRHAS